MIYATVNMTIGDYSSTCDNKILLYRGDKNVEIRIVMKGNKFTVLDSTYAQMIIRRPSATSVFSEPAPIQNDTVIFVITEDMIDELKEIGEYTFQIRLYDDTMTARATLPPCKSALIIERPIAVEGEAAVNLAIVNDSAVMLADTTSVEEDIFTEDNKYNRTIWVDGDLITDARLNKIEDALYYINENGGNGSGGGATAPYISTELPETVMVGSDENFDLHLFFNSPNIGKGTLRVFINDADSMSIKIDQGDSTTVVSNNLFAKGTNRVVVYVLDRVGVMSNSLVFYIRYGSTEISSDFDPYSAYDYGATIRYYFTPTALDTSLSLTFYMSIDGQVQQGVNCTSDTRGYYTFPTNLSADSHYCEAYVVDSKGVKSNVLSFNLIILDADTLVVASDTKEISVEEGEQVSLDYKVYMKYNTSFIANIYVDDALVNTGTCNADFNYYKTSSLTKGVHTVKLEVFDVTETHSDYITWTVAVSDSTYEMLQPVNAGAMFIGTAVNKTNTDERKQYFIGHDQEGNEVLGTLTNFAYNSESGWVNDELIISGNSHVEIPVQPLANNAKYGFTLDIEFTSKQIGVTDAEVLTLWNDETNCGVKITTEKLILQSSNGNKCDLYFTDNEKTHVMFVIDRQELKAKIYLNGVMCEAFHLNDYTVEGVAYLDDFTVNSNIILGGLNTNGYCKIRNLRVYQVALTTDEIMNNFISCEIDKAKQRELSEFQKGNDLPTLYVYCDFSGLGKDDKKPCKIVYNSTNEALYGKSFNLDHKQSQLQYQGTSSMAYPIKNYRLNLRDENGDKWYYTLPTAQPECRFTLKADFMSSGHWTNTGMAKFINDKLYNYNVNDEKSMNPFKWNHVQNGGKVNDFRETITGFPCRLILVNDGETPLNTGQNEPTPGNTKDMGIFNFNNDKDNVTTLGFNSDIFPNCASYEVTANSDTSAGAFMSYKSTPIIEIAKHTVDGNEYYVTMYMSPLLPPNSIVKTDAEISAATRYNENAFDIHCNTIQVPKQDEGVYEFRHNNVGTHYRILFNVNTCPTFIEINDVQYNVKIVEEYPENVVKEPYIDNSGELAYLKESFELRHPDEDDVAEDWGFMGVDSQIFLIDYSKSGSFKYTTKIERAYTGEVFTIEVPNQVFVLELIRNDNSSSIKYGLSGVQTITLAENEVSIRVYSANWEEIIINGDRLIPGDDINNLAVTKNPYEANILDSSLGLKALIDWVDNCTDEEFVADFEEHFHKDYTLRYFCLVTLIGAVDNLGKNMMLDTADHKIFFPRFYDIDTICSYDNSGQLKFDVDIEMEQGYWNTSSSRLWTRIRDLMHDDIVTTYNNMRQNGVSYENMMHYIYDEQIAKIPQAYYNKDYDVKYAPFADSYIGMAHGDTYEHVKRWLKQRFAFVDTLFDYAPSYNNDILTIRANTTELMTLEIETYTPVYLHLSWYNGQMDKKKIDGKTSVAFSGKAQAATDQEVLIYGGSNVKSIKGIQSANPNRLILGSATKLIELDASNCPLLAEINMNKANLSPHEYLNKVNLSNCPLLEGNLRLNNSPLIQELDIRGTNITGMNLPSSIRNLQVLRLPNTMTELTLNDAGMLHTLEFDEGVKMQSVAMTNCNALENVINFDLLQTPSITLNNSYNTAAELYFRDTTNLSLSNMPNLERVIFTPNNEYETFELINVANAPDYKVTTFNCPKLSTFMTTAPYRESYNDCDLVGKVIVTDEDVDLFKDELANYKVGTLHANTGEFLENPTSIVYEKYFEVLPSTTYTLACANQVRLVTYDENKQFIQRNQISSPGGTITVNSNAKYIRFSIYNTTTPIEVSCMGKSFYTIQVKDYGDIQPNTTFTANSIDISSTQFTDVKLLCTTDTNTLKLPTTIKNFYCDSSFDLDTDYLEDGEYDVVHGELVEPYTTDYEGEVKRTIINSINVKDSAIGNKQIIVEYSEKYPYGNYVVTSENDNSEHYITDFIKVTPGSKITIPFTSFNNKSKSVSLVGYPLDKSVGYRIYYKNAYDISLDYTVPEWMEWIKASTDFDNIKINYEGTYTPNLIPSSADGSLIFSMYAPNNTVAPASGTWDLHGLEFDNFHTFGMNNDVRGGAELTELTVGSYLPISMPARYDDYNITIKNAYIAPKTHNTMLYPLLVNEDNPIAGTLDYTNYAGKHLSWSFAYTDEEYVNIIQPKDELLNSYEHKYNAFYDTEYEFDNPYEIARYTSNATGVLPTFNKEFTYTYDEINNGDGTYTTKIYADRLDILPTWLSYQNKTNLLSVEKLKTGVLVSAEAMFQGCSSLTSVNVSQMDVSNVGQIYRMFYGCNKLTEIQGIDNLSNGSFINLWEMFLGCGSLTELDLSGFNTSNVTSMDGMFNGCSGLTSLNLSGFNTSNVTSMANMFANCSGLTSLDLSGFDTKNVTNMHGMFRSCSGLTSLDLSGFDTKNVNTMQNMFGSCGGLTSIDLSGFDTSNVTNMESMFYGCNGLTSLDLSGFDTKNVTNMYGMFYNCSKLTSLDVSGFDTKNVNGMAGMFYNCSGLTSLDVSNFDTSNVTIMSSMFRDCSGLTSLDVSNFDTSNVTNMSDMFAYCSGLTSLDLSGFDISKVTDMYNMFVYCSGLTSLNVSNWSLDKVNTIIPQLSVSPSTSTLYGTVIIDETKLPSGWVYDNALIIAKYTANATGVLPGFNKEFTGYTTVETDNGDGTYTVSIATDSLDNLPTKISFTSNNNLLRVDKLNTSKVTSMHQMFRSCEKLTRMNCGLDTSGVTNEISQMFIGCSKLEYVNATNLVGSNIKYASTLFSGCTLLKQIDGLDTWDTSELTSFESMFHNCSSLTSLDVSGFDTSKATTMSCMFQNCSSLTSLDVSGFDTSNVTRMHYIFNNCSSLTSLDVSGFDTSKVTDMRHMFDRCSGLTSLDLSGFDTSNVTTMEGMFGNCTNLTELNLQGWKVRNIDFMFSNCTNLQRIDTTNWDTSELTNIGHNLYQYSGLFYLCSSLTEIIGIENWNTSKIATMGATFKACSSLTTLDLSNWDTSSVTDLNCMFDGCIKLTSLDISGFDTSNVTGMHKMFHECQSLTSLDLSGFETGKVTDMSYMFRNCKVLTELVGLTNWDTSAVTNISYAFQSLPLTNLDLGGWDLTNCTAARDAWNFMYSLGSIVFPNNLSVSFGIGQSFNLTADNIVEIFNKLATVTTTQTADIGANLLNKLVEYQITIATNKGWTVV